MIDYIQKVTKKYLEKLKNYGNILIQNIDTVKSSNHKSDKRCHKSSINKQC